MQTSIIKIKKQLTLIFFGAILTTLHSAWADSDKQLQEKALKAREMTRLGEVDHAEHMNAEDQTGGFHGVFYGYLPCKEKGCDGLKMTLSLKQKNNYLLVSQPAKASNREFYDKGKYAWDDKTHTLSLTSNKDAGKKLFTIKDEGSLILLGNSGAPLQGDQDDYTLKRSDVYKTREMHIH